MAMMEDAVLASIDHAMEVVKAAQRSSESTAVTYNSDMDHTDHSSNDQDQQEAQTIRELRALLASRDERISELEGQVKQQAAQIEDLKRGRPPLKPAHSAPILAAYIPKQLQQQQQQQDDSDLDSVMTKTPKWENAKM